MNPHQFPQPMSETVALTPWEQLVYAAIVEAAAAGLVCPSNLDLEMLIGCSSGSIPSIVVKRLERKGLIRVTRFQRTRDVQIIATGDCTARSVAVRSERPHKPGGMSSREADTFESAMDGVTSDLTDSMAKQDSEAANGMAVQEKLVGSVQTKLQDAGFTPDAARQQAELIAQRVTTRAGRMGQSVTGNEFDTQVKQVLPPALEAARKADNVDLVIAALRKGGDAVSNPGPTLNQWIAKRGGVNDSGGDLASLGLDKWHVGKPGQRKVIRPFDPQGALGGISGAGDYGADSTLRAAIDAGYFPELANVEGEHGPSTLDTQALHDAMADELGGQARYATAGRVDPMRAAADELRDLLGERGIDPATLSDAQLRAVVEKMDAVGPEGGFEQSRDDVARWGSAVDSVVRGDKVGSPLIRLSPTPAVLQALGLPEGEMVMARAKIARARREHPEVPLATWKDLPRLETHSEPERDGGCERDA